MKPLVWIGSSRDDLREMDPEVQDQIGKELLVAQLGLIPARAKPLSGFGGASILEIVLDCETNTYRAIYTVRFATAIYVLHIFMKKAQEGRKTPKRHIDLVRVRLRRAEEVERERTGDDPIH